MFEDCVLLCLTVFDWCLTATSHTQVGPRYASGGDEQNPCQYTFLWETTGACPIKPIKSPSCQLTLPSGFTFDLSPLHSPPNNNNTNNNNNINNNRDAFYRVSSETSPAFSFDLAVCGSLPSPCNGKTGVPVCQVDSTNKSHACGLNTTQQLVYFDGSLYLKYSSGDLCRHNGRNRSVLVNFECDRTARPSTTAVPRYLRELDCGYSFEWPTPLACEPQELGCVAAGGKYDLTPLLGNRRWEVETAEQGGAFVYVVGGCRLAANCISFCSIVGKFMVCAYRLKLHV